MALEKLVEKFKKVRNRIFRNSYSDYDVKLKKNRVNLIYWKVKTNVGDAISPIICEWMLNKIGGGLNRKTKKTYALTAVGSVIHFGMHDSVVWGSGILSENAIKIIKKRKYKKYDIRAVRGPITREAMSNYNCPQVYGDPAILMPLIYQPNLKEQKKFDASLVLHFSTLENYDLKDLKINVIDVLTDDYKFFIDQIVSSRKIISSSLHGIILAESYGVPAVLLKRDSDEEMIKYYDYYYSTNRREIKVANTIQEALTLEPMPLPDLKQMQEDLIKSFPYDLWQ